jgi:hypothetical protein
VGKITIENINSKKKKDAPEISPGCNPWAGASLPRELKAGNRRCAIARTVAGNENKVNVFDF